MRQDHARIKPIPNPVTRQEILEIGRGILDEQEQALFFFLFLSGARISEALKVKPVDIEVDNDAGWVHCKLLTLKNKLKNFRRIPIVDLHDQVEEQIWAYVEDWITRLPQLEELPIFDMSRKSAAKKLAKIKIELQAMAGKQSITLPGFAVHPHYLRHCRLTDCVVVRNYDHIKLMQFAGWTNTAPADVYVSLNWRQLAIRGGNNNGLH